MGMYGDDYEYANSRLTETIVRYKNEPVYVHNVVRGMVVTCHRLDNDEIIVCKVDDLDLQPVPLGYCNYNKYACYLSRIPMRRDWRQGLRRGNFASISGVSADRIPYNALRQAIVGDFPTFAAAVETAKKVKSIAWHRHWAIGPDLCLMHKGAARPVGKVIDGVPTLDSRYMYLTEALKESL